MGCHETSTRTKTAACVRRAKLGASPARGVSVHATIARQRRKKAQWGENNEGSFRGRDDGRSAAGGDGRGSLCTARRFGQRRQGQAGRRQGRSPEGRAAGHGGHHRHAALAAEGAGGDRGPQQRRRAAAQRGRFAEGGIRAGHLQSAHRSRRSEQDDPRRQAHGHRPDAAQAEPGQPHQDRSRRSVRTREPALHRRSSPPCRPARAPPAYRSTRPARWRWSPTAARGPSRSSPSAARR